MAKLNGALQMLRIERPPLVAVNTASRPAYLSDSGTATCMHIAGKSMPGRPVQRGEPARQGDEEPIFAWLGLSAGHGGG